MTDDATAGVDDAPAEMPTEIVHTLIEPINLGGGAPCVAVVLRRPKTRVLRQALKASGGFARLMDTLHEVAIRIARARLDDGGEAALTAAHWRDKIDAGDANAIDQLCATFLRGRSDIDADAEGYAELPREVEMTLSTAVRYDAAVEVDRIFFRRPSAGALMEARREVSNQADAVHTSLELAARCGWWDHPDRGPLRLGALFDGLDIADGLEAALKVRPFLAPAPALTTRP